MLIIKKKGVKLCINLLIYILNNTSNWYATIVLSEWALVYDISDGTWDEPRKDRHEGGEGGITAHWQDTDWWGGSITIHWQDDVGWWNCIPLPHALEEWEQLFPAVLAAAAAPPPPRTGRQWDSSSPHVAAGDSGISRPIPLLCAACNEHHRDALALRKRRKSFWIPHGNRHKPDIKQCSLGMNVVL